MRLRFPNCVDTAIGWCPCDNIWDVLPDEMSATTDPWSIFADQGSRPSLLHRSAELSDERDVLWGLHHLWMKEDSWLALS